MPELKRKILIIDDNAAIHADFQKILSPAARVAEVEDVDALAAEMFGAGEAPKTAAGLKYEVSHAYQGQEGLRLVEEAAAGGDPFQLAFVDIRMPPGWDGLETIEALWKVDPHLQTIICSAYSDYSWSEIYQRLGNSDRLLVLKKPFDCDEIFQIAASLTEKYHLARTARLKVEELDGLVAQRTAALQESNTRLTLEIEQRRRMEERLRHAALHDRLTGLPNRALLFERIDACIRQQREDGRLQFALLFMDMDDFKVVNDSLGHEAGDQLLIGIGERLSQAVRGSDVAGRFKDDVTSRLGGDEFVVLLEGLTSAEDAVAVAERISRVMREPFAVGSHQVVANLSIGIAAGHPGYERAADILRDADTAVYGAKKQGKNCHAMFDAPMHAQARERFEMEAELRKALGAGQFVLHYQPVVCLETGDIVGFEALLRWAHPERGLIPPGSFIPVAELSGLVVPIGAEVLRQACAQIGAWRKAFGIVPEYQQLWVAVNLSAKQLNCPEFLGDVERATREAGVPADAVHFEIMETVVAEEGDAAIACLAKLQALGHRLALDDFGTGYSSLSHLHRMPVNSVKIDQSFVRKMEGAGRSYSATVQAVVDLAHNCGMSVVGEGVETASQLVQLQALECDTAQGYWFSKPVPAEEAERMLRENLANRLWRGRIQELARAHAGEGMAVAG